MANWGGDELLRACVSWLLRYCPTGMDVFNDTEKVMGFLYLALVVGCQLLWAARRAGRRVFAWSLWARAVVCPPIRAGTSSTRRSSLGIGICRGVGTWAKSGICSPGWTFRPAGWAIPARTPPWGRLGPTLVLGRARWPVSVESGFSPTCLSSHVFESKDLGTDIQFTSHVGLNWDFAAHWRLGYRFQHMSNADLARSNPGLNMHLFALSYLF